MGWEDGCRGKSTDCLLLERDWVHCPVSSAGGSQPLVISVLGDLTPSPGLRWHGHSHMHMPAHVICTQLKIK